MESRLGRAGELYHVELERWIPAMAKTKQNSRFFNLYYYHGDDDLNGFPSPNPLPLPKPTFQNILPKRGIQPPKAEFHRVLRF